jgi:hypothetical protein
MYLALLNLSRLVTQVGVAVAQLSCFHVFTSVFSAERAKNFKLIEINYLDTYQASPTVIGPGNFDDNVTHEKYSELPGQYASTAP